MQKFYQLKVRKTEYITPTIKKITFTSESEKLPHFGAGSHISLKLPMGTRQYSLINDPLQDESEYTIAVKNVGKEGGGSSFIHHHVKPGDSIEAAPPENYFPIRSEARHHLFLAAGIGITPFLSMMAFLTQTGQHFDLHYAGSSASECAFYPMIKKRYSDHAHFYFMEREQKEKELQRALRNQSVGTHIYICGPSAFMDHYMTYCKALGYPDENIHSERFRPAGRIQNPKAFRVTEERSAKTLYVDSDQSLLEALIEEGIMVPYACRMGVCGTCEVEVCNGSVLHNETFLTEEERKEKMLSCVSRGEGQITIKV
ncbi:PDR/VanB family oxidoreductase [Pseudalkalibacillus sp. Hm43]|uniref:PDR/VanB family oxidoreductase n=1 Tax=Pseudalkalibacillus sp. Hm43 TaxID=3450742 RepID=UPI003F43DEE1